MFDALRKPRPRAGDDAVQPGQALALHWQRLRRAPRDSDQALNGTARRWLRELPPRRRPLRLCALYPRVANRLAWCWRDPKLAAQALDDLLTDRRGGRRGFPPAVQRELQRLRDALARGLPREASPWWQGWLRSWGV